MAAIASFGRIWKRTTANRLADPENLYIPGFKGILKKSEKKLVARWRPFWLSVESWKNNQVTSILMGNFTWKIGEIQ